MKSIAIIPARGGSKRIPQKNIKLFLGKPIISYSIDAARSSGIFHEVMVSTDSNEVANIAIEIGASVPFMRNPKTSSDYAVTADVISEVIEKYEQIGESFDSICCIYATAPFVTAEKLKIAMDLLYKEKVDTVHPVIPYSFPPQRGYWIRENKVVWVDPTNELTRSQDLEMMYHDAGQFYCINTASFLQTRRLIGPKTMPIVCSELEAQDIDNEDDWKLAEMKYIIARKVTSIL